MIAGQLEIQLLANVARLRKDMSSAERNVRQTTEKIENFAGKAKTALGAIGLGLSAGILVSKFKAVAVETDKLRGNLVTVTGSANTAGLAFDRLTQFAAQTPFTLDQSVNAFIKLKALGLDPSERALASYGNTASAMGKDMNQMIEAVADASTMEFERLKEFGIKAKQQNDSVSFTFQGLTTTVGKNATEIQEYLLGIGENKFGDAMANQMDRLPGKLSNLEDSVDGLFRRMADRGGTDLFGQGIELAIGFVEQLTEGVDSFADGWPLASAQVFTAVESMQINLSGLSSSVSGFASNGAMSLESFRFAFFETIGAVGDKNIGVVQGMVRAWSIGVTNIVAGVQSMGVRIGYSLDHIALFFGMSQKSALEFAEEIAKINMASTGAQRQIQQNADATFRELDRLRDQIIANRNSTEDLSASSATLSEILGGLEDPTQNQSEAIETLTDKETKLIQKLEQQLKMLGLTAREQAIFTEVTRLGSDATQEAIDKVTVLAGRLYDEQQALKTTTAEGQIHKNMVENLQREWANLIDTFISGESDVGDFFDTLVKGIKRAVAEAAAADLAGLLFGGGTGNLSGLFSGAGNIFSGGTGVNSVLSNGASIAGGAGLSGLLAGASQFLGGLTGTGVGAGSAIVGAPTAATAAGMNAAAFAGPAAIAAAAALAGKIIHDKTNDPDGFHRAMGGFLGAHTPGAPAGSTFGVTPFASGFTPIGFADGPTSIADAMKNIDPFRFVDQTVFDLVSQIPGANIDTSRSTFGGFNVDGSGTGTFFGKSQRTSDAQFQIQLDNFAQQLGDHITGLTPETLARIAGANSVDSLVSVLTDLTKTVDQSNAQARRAQSTGAQLTAQQRDAIVARVRSNARSVDPAWAEKVRRESVQRNLEMVANGYDFRTGIWSTPRAAAPQAPSPAVLSSSPAFGFDDADFKASMYDFVQIAKDWHGRGMPPERAS